MSEPDILLINGNTTASVTDKLLTHSEALFPGVRFHARTPAFGPAYVSSPADVAIASHGVLSTIEQAIATLGHEPDACVIACFGEPRLLGARHQWAFPIVGLAEASALTALQLGARRYGVLTVGRYWPAMLQDLFRLYGLDQRCAGIMEVKGNPLGFAADPLAARRALEACIAGMMQRHAPDAIILGGASLVGISHELQADVPLIDCLEAGIGQALSMISMAGRGLRMQQAAS